MNLFVAIVLQVIMRLIIYSTPDIDENSVSYFSNAIPEHYLSWMLIQA